MWILRSFRACVHLGKHNIVQEYNSLARTTRWYSEKKVFNRDKPCCKIGTIGHAKHGKSTLTAAISKLLDGSGSVKKLLSETSIATQIEYESDNRHYIHTDCPGAESYVKNMMSGVTQMNGAILVIAANEGVLAQTLEHTMLAKQSGIEHLVVFINKVDAADAQMIELVEIEAREMLTTAGFDGDSLPIICGSALSALNDEQPEIGSEAINKLLCEIDSYIPTPVLDLDKPFVLPIERVFSVPKVGTVVRGILEQGTMKKGDKCDILGYGDVLRSTIISLEICYGSLDEAIAGDQVSAALRGTQRDDLKRGMVLAKPGCLKLVDHVDAQVYILTKKEGGKFQPFNSFSIVTIFSKTWDCTAQVLVDDSKAIPGEHVRITLKLIKPMVFEIGQSFTIREGQMTLGTGVVATVHKNLTDDERLEIQGGRRVRERNARLAEQKAKKSK